MAETPKGAESIAGIASPKGKKAAKNAYMHLGHGKDHVVGEPLSVPAGCVYVTFALCGQVGKDSHRILGAFEDPAIKDLLRDPVRHLKRLTTYFGDTLHVHYPEAEDPTSRTYYDTTYRPFLGYSVKDHATCFAKKSGVYRLGDLATFKAPAALRSSEIHASARDYTAAYSCEEVGEDALKYIYRGSLYPTPDQISASSFKELKKVSKEHEYRQSWAFSVWPGVHYNFVCRGLATKEESIKNSATRKRRRNSLAAAEKLLSRGGSRRR